MLVVAVTGRVLLLFLRIRLLVLSRAGVGVFPMTSQLFRMMTLAGEEAKHRERTG